MARPADSNSARTRVLPLVDDNVGLPRAAILSIIMDEFNVSLSYAKTLYQHWRNVNKENTGSLTEVFVVRDHKDGVTVPPYMFSKFIKDVDDKMSTSVIDAITAYVEELRIRKIAAKKLK